jgi:leucine dehydrogenase
MGLSGLDHELLQVRRGARSGAYTIVAVHSTALGPALGGCRLTTYPHPADAVADALRLAAGMTLKAAVAGVDLGGGKGVVCVEPGTELTAATREAMLLDFGDAVEALGGRYITAEDVGTSPADMRLVATRTEHLVGLPEDLGGLGDPSPFTALGVHAAMRAAVEHRFGTTDLAGRSVAVVGAGHVGEALARMLAADGARVIVSDIDEAKRGLADELEGADGEGARERIADIEALMRRILTEAAGVGITPLAAAHAIAERRLAASLATV